MSKRWNLVLSGLIAAAVGLSLLCAALLFVWPASSAAPPLSEGGDEGQGGITTQSMRLLGSISTEQISAIRVANPEDQYTIQNSDAGYAIEDLSADQVDQAAVDKLFNDLTLYGLEFIIGSEGALPEQYGFDVPSAVVMIEVEGGSPLLITLGLRYAFDDYYYAKVDGVDGVFLAPLLLAVPLLQTRDSFYDLSFFAAIDETNAASLTRVAIYDAGKEPVEIVQLPEPGADGSLRYALTSPSAQRIETQEMASTVLYALSLLSGDYLVAEGVEDLAPYGLDAPERVVEMSFMGEEIRILLGAAVEGDAEHRYAMREGSGTVFALKAFREAVFELDLIALIGEKAYPFELSELSALRVEAGGAASDFVIEGERVLLNGQEIDAAAFAAWFEGLSALRFEGEVDPSVARGTEQLLRIESTLIDGSTQESVFVSYDARSVTILQDGVAHYHLFERGVSDVIDGFLALAGLA